MPNLFKYLIEIGIVSEETVVEGGSIIVVSFILLCTCLVVIMGRITQKYEDR